MEEWIKKIDICNGVFFSAKPKKKIQPFATTWMELEGIMLHEISKTERHKYCMISLICGL